MKPIRILESDANKRGDLFGRLMADLFVALGYEQPSMNIHQSGREVDLRADHRFEPRRAIGECKATDEAIGGADLNKFVGVMDAEHDEKVQLSGYFISLSGFKETALEQESRRKTKVVTLNGEQIVTELINGRIIISRERATELAGRCCAQSPDLSLDGKPELLAHERGWIWIAYYSSGKQRNSFVLIHADGTPLSAELAQQVIDSEKRVGGQLHELTCLNPSTPPSPSTTELAPFALAAYDHYVAEECGYIQLDGLPADSDVGSRRLRLENLFVPLHLNVKDEDAERRSIGNALTRHPRLAILSAPGGGKSTLIKRIAVAYADPSRRSLVQDDLPDRNWLPLFFRCRELRGLARASFAELLLALSQREPVRQFSETFQLIVDRALSDGRVLLLIDGLDEIPDAGDRAAFVCTMRTALQAYPGTGIIVTSREAGFRHVAAHLAQICTYATLSPFDVNDIRRLTVAWHEEVVGTSDRVRADAEQLADTISGIDRIQRLAINPLLLTTLLLVKRWVGSLPTRRAALYGKAVEVLLMTWNTEGHEPIPEEEALPQLCYVASAMMIANIERVSRPRLASLIQEARESLPTELGYVKGTVEDFIHRVEDRSSLLMMTGLDIEDGRLVEFFEFRHLTFQEFLCARGMVEGWHPGRKDSDTLTSALEEHFGEEKWREVIPLAASLGGKATEALIRRLTEKCTPKGQDDRIDVVGKPLPIALGHCLADEAAARPETIRAALRALILRGLINPLSSFVPMLAKGRYGEELRDESEKLLLTQKEPRAASMALKQAALWQLNLSDKGRDLKDSVALYRSLLESKETLSRCKGALAFVNLIDGTDELKLMPSVVDEIATAAIPLLYSEQENQHYCAGWLLYTIGRLKLWTPSSSPDVLGRMFYLWRKGTSAAVREGLASTLALQRIAPRDDSRRLSSVDRRELDALIRDYASLSDVSAKIATLVVAWYTHGLPNEKLIELAQGEIEKTLSSQESTLRDLLGQLGVRVRPRGQRRRSAGTSPTQGSLAI